LIWFCKRLALEKAVPDQKLDTLANVGFHEILQSMSKCRQDLVSEPLSLGFFVTDDIALQEFDKAR
jgi:hypothetical protein